MAEEICAEIVGNVIRMVAREGQDLVAGDVIFLVESMKMEIPVIANLSGNLARIMVREGDFVREGEPVAVISHSGPR